MSAAHRTRSVSPQASANYLKKAQEFAAAMESALQEERWNAAALAAVHAAISAGDALLAAFAGIRSAEQDHRHIVTLLPDHLGKDGEQASKHIRRVITLKNLVEYEERLIRAAEAAQMATHVRRLMTLVRSRLPPVESG